MIEEVGTVTKVGTVIAEESTVGKFFDQVG